jgi:hypothetical protein
VAAVPDAAPPLQLAPSPAPPSLGEGSTTSRTRPGDFARFLRRADSSVNTDRKPGPTGESSSFKGLIDPSTRLDANPAKLPPAVEAPPPEAPRIRQAAVPVLNHPMEELIGFSFTPNEAFILSRVNGLWDVRSIAKISPFTETEVLRVFQKLEDGGVISWR